VANKYSFKVIPRSRLTETVENHIRKLILQGDIKPGDKLPTEEEIGKQFGVSIVTVREAIRGLEVLGLIEKRKGKNGGIFVTEININPFKDAVGTYLRSKNLTSSDIAQLRLIIEPAATEIATSQVTIDEIAAIEKNIVVCEERIKRRSQDLSRKDFWYVEERNVEFHRLLAEATHNPVIALTMDYVLDIVLNFKKNTLQVDTRFCIETTEAHRDILTLVRSDQPGKAKAAMIEHLSEVDSYLAKVEVGKHGLSGTDRPSSRVATRKP
jgi:DNA-binding FadR family transcriptional regulator